MNEEIRKELENLGSSLAKEKHRVDYEVPEGYFNKMQEDVLLKLKSGENKEIKVYHFKNWMYASAAIVILLLGTLIVLRNYSTPESALENIDTEAIYAYLNDNLDELTLQQLIPENIDFESIVIDENTDIIENYLEENLEDLQLEELEELL